MEGESPSLTQINLIKFIESNKFDNVYNEIWRVFVWSNLGKNAHALFHKTNLMKSRQSKLKSSRLKKYLFTKKNNSRIQIVQPKFTTWKYKKISAAAVSGGVL